jgi:hypothetical protein
MLLYAEFITPFGSGDGTVMVLAGLMVMLKGPELGPLPSTTEMVKVYVPAIVGVPFNSQYPLPEEPTSPYASPGGRFPLEVQDVALGVELPVLKLTLKPDPTSQVGRAAGVWDCAPILSENDFDTRPTAVAPGE